MQVMSFTECHDDAILGSLIEIVCGMKNLYLPVLLALIHTFATAATPVPDENCIDIPDSSDSCSPLLACFGNSGEYFAGRALGRDEGTFAGVTNFGQSARAPGSLAILSEQERPISNATMAIGARSFSIIVTV